MISFTMSFTAAFTILFMEVFMIVFMKNHPVSWTGCQMYIQNKFYTST